MVRQWQQIFYEKRYSCTTMDYAPDFAKLAEAYGAVGLRATKPSEVEPVLQEAMSTPRPVIMDFVVEKRKMSTPWYPPANPSRKCCWRNLCLKSKTITIAIPQDFT